MPLKVIDEFKVSRLQILDEEGNADRELEPDLGQDDLVGMYRAMVLARQADQRVLKLQRQGRVGTVGLCTGQEASSVGPALAMGKDDWFVGAFRELGGRLVRGEPLVNFFLFHNGFEEGNRQPQGTSPRLLPISVIVGSQALHGVGIGYAMKVRGEKAAAVTFFGDGATSEGDLHEALNFASVWQAPVVFVCQNNQWAISVARDKQTRSRSIAQKAIAYGIPGLQVDGNDVLAMYVATKQALERAYAGEGPTLIEAVTYRLMMHTTADDPKKYRSEDEVQPWWKKEPLLRFRKYLEGRGYWNEKKQASLDEEVKNEIDEAVRDFEARQDFKPDAPFDHGFGTEHEEIEEQRRQFLTDLEHEREAGNG